MSKTINIQPSDQSAITSLLEHLIRMPTVSADRATNAAALDWVENQLAGLPLHIRRLTNQQVPALIATTSGTPDPKAPRLWLAGHMDVVPGPARVFEPRIEDTRLYGRGASDMKSALAVFIHLLQTLGQNLASYDLGFMITCDEEVGGFDGAHWLVDGGYRGEAMVLPDAGKNWDIEPKSKGIMWYEVTATGTSAHGSRPWNGDNAITKLTAFIDTLASQYPSEPCGDEHHAHGTLNVGTIAGGSIANQVPDKAIAHLDLRLLPDELIGTKHQELEAVAAQHPGITLTQLVAEPGFELHYDGALRHFSRIAETVRGQKLSSSLSHASSDARHFIPVGIQVIAARATGGDHHSDNEWIDLEDLTVYYQIIKQFTEEWAKR